MYTILDGKYQTVTAESLLSARNWAFARLSVTESIHHKVIIQEAFSNKSEYWILSKGKIYGNKKLRYKLNVHEQLSLKEINDKAKINFDKAVRRLINKSKKERKIQYKYGLIHKPTTNEIYIRRKGSTEVKKIEQKK